MGKCSILQRLDVCSDLSGMTSPPGARPREPQRRSAAFVAVVILFKYLCSGGIPATEHLVEVLDKKGHVDQPHFPGCVFFACREANIPESAGYHSDVTWYSQGAGAVFLGSMEVAGANLGSFFTGLS